MSMFHTLSVQETYAIVHIIFSKNIPRLQLALATYGTANQQNVLKTKWNLNITRKNKKKCAGSSQSTITGASDFSSIALIPRIDQTFCDVKATITRCYLEKLTSIALSDLVIVLQVFANHVTSIIVILALQVVLYAASGIHRH